MRNASKSMVDSTLQKAITAFLVAVSPAGFNLLGYYIFCVRNSYSENLVILISSIVGLVLAFLVNLTLPYFFVLFPKGRLFAKYEGKWLQIIPGFERPFSIIDFKYNREIYAYEMHGINFSEDLQKHVVFDAYRFVERVFHDGFYYITNPTSQHTNGLGKICFIGPNEDDLTRAEGYFFDSGSAEFSREYKTYLIKCDKKFFNRLNKGGLYRNFNKISAVQLMNDCKELAMKEKNRYPHIQYPPLPTCEKSKQCNGCHNISKHNIKVTKIHQKEETL